MKNYSVHAVAKLLHMPKDTLRYYDKLGLVSPSRGENRYRYYTERDILDLQYIETFKYADFSLAEIRQFFNYMRSLASTEDCDNIELLFEDKKAEYKQKIKAYKTMILLIDKMLSVKKQIASPGDVIKANELVVRVFQEIREEQSGRNEK
jgi:Predicted transcriptional regulators